jgi:hypothetical protein
MVALAVYRLMPQKWMRAYNHLMTSNYGILSLTAAALSSTFYIDVVIKFTTSFAGYLPK